MSTKSFSSNFTFNTKTSDALVKAIDVSTPVSSSSLQKHSVLTANDLKVKLMKKTSANA